MDQIPPDRNAPEIAGNAGEHPVTGPVDQVKGWMAKCCPALLYCGSAADAAFDGDHAPTPQSQSTTIPDGARRTVLSLTADLVGGQHKVVQPLNRLRADQFE